MTHSTVRKKLTHDMRTREKIRTAHLIKKLERFILSDPTTKAFEKNKMTSAQVTAALGLIRKTLPDLAIVEAQIETTSETTVKNETTVKHVISQEFNDWIKQNDGGSGE